MKQAVILAGGLGARLMPITESTPKPLVEVNGRPFLAYIIDDLKKFGYTDIIVLTGYLSDEFSRYFGDDKTVKCLQTDVAFTKGERLRAASQFLDEKFMLLYGDNYIPEQFKEVDLGEEEAMFTLAEKIPGNVSINPLTSKLSYHRERGIDSHYVELGYMLIRKASLFKYLSVDLDLDQALQVMTEIENCTYRVLKGPYFSVSDGLRLEITRNAFRKKKVIFLDRDGIINNRMPKGDYVKNVDQCTLITENIAEIENLSKKGFKFIIISNQAGVARGIMSEKDLSDINKFIIQELSLNGIDVVGTFYCLHGWDENCGCRKPLPGMLLRAAKEFSLLLKNCVYIGDDIRDEQAAIAAGCRPILIGKDFDYEFGKPKSKVYSTFKEAMNEILDFYGVNAAGL